MAKDKLVPEPPETEKTGPKGRFIEVASKVFTVSKVEIDKREERWKKQREEDRQG